MADDATTTEVPYLSHQPLDEDADDDNENTIGGPPLAGPSMKEKLVNAQAGVFAGLKSGVSKVLESKPVAKGVGYGKTIIESEKVQKGVKYVNEKAAAVAANEKVQLGTKVVKEKATLVKDKATESVGFIKGTSKSAWQGGKVQIERVRNSIREGEWKGSAASTLGVSEKEGLWKDIKVKGAEEIVVGARKEYTTSYHVEKGYIMRWTFRVKDHDLGFGVRMRVMQDGGSVEQEVLPVEKFDDQETISGSTYAEETRTLVLVFDNKHSKLRTKTVAYIVGVECAKPAVEEPIIIESEDTMVGQEHYSSMV